MHSGCARAVKSTYDAAKTSLTTLRGFGEGSVLLCFHLLNTHTNNCLLICLIPSISCRVSSYRTAAGTTGSFLFCSQGPKRFVKFNSCDFPRSISTNQSMFVSLLCSKPVHLVPHGFCTLHRLIDQL